MNKYMEIIRLVLMVIAIISSLVSIITMVIAKQKKKKVEKLNGDELELAKEELEKLEDVNKLAVAIIPNAMEMAEKIGGTGEYKNLIAKSKIIQDCVTNDIDYNENSEVISQLIETFIELTKQVNNKNNGVHRI